MDIRTDQKFMRAALKEAHKAYLKNEVPVGAVIVCDGKVIARGHNNRERTNDPTSHAEVEAIRKATRKLSSWRLSGCTLYVTIEPCSMCAGTILWGRLDRVVFGACDLKGGALGSSYNLYEQKNINHRPQVTSGVLEDECKKIMQEFFKQKRKQAL